MPAPRSTGTVLGDLRVNGAAWKVLRKDPDKMRDYLPHVLAQLDKWDERTRALLLCEMQFAAWWMDAGCVVYELTHDISALFAMTSAPPLEWSRAPHDAFVIKVPRSLFPLDGVTDGADSWIFAARRGALVVADHDTIASLFIGYADSVSSDQLEKRLDSGKAREEILCSRFLANTIAYIQQHRECVRPKGLSARSRSMFTVRPPGDVVITREFRDAAIAAVSAGTLASVRRALAHVVRGHWRNQPVGEGRRERKLTWIRPHRRGDESLGRVVQRIERLR